MIFYNVCYYFWGKHFCWTATIIISKYFFACVSFHCLRLFYFPPALPLLRRPWMHHAIAEKQTLFKVIKKSNLCILHHSVHLAPEAQATSKSHAIAEKQTLFKVIKKSKAFQTRNKRENSEVQTKGSKNGSPLNFGWAKN